MALFSASNQLLQIDTGSALTYLYNASLSPISIYAGIGENQVLGQRYIASVPSLVNPSGAPAIYMLVQYNSTAQPAPVAAPAPVYWKDATYTLVTGVESESALGLNGVAGYLMPNTASITTLTAAILQTALVLIQVAGPLTGAYAATAGAAGVGNSITGSAGNWTSTGTASGTAAPSRTLGIQASVVSAGICNVLVTADIF